MKRIGSIIKGSLILLVGMAAVVLLLNGLTAQDSKENTLEKPIEKKSIHLVAIGDSLTQGVGDSQDAGGYVPRIQKKLTSLNSVKEVVADNYGVAGERSDEILSRMTENEKMKNDLKTADIVVLTAGGNDILQVFKKEKLAVSTDSFEKTLEDYRENLKTILEQIHLQNTQSQVYVFGLYNPYSAVFADVSEMKMILDEWNGSIDEIVSSDSQGTFLPIQTIFSQPKKQTKNLDTATSSELQQYDATDNPYLYEKDLFHPNDAGYEKMTDVLFEAIQEKAASKY
ncbi:MAG: GDSL-type esterase/lipase family protein [Pisciglobus halotolerans]|nr:GDSL-type esterase/lipase family protein [Pisciglobus halotolerans]